jgi:glutamate---cysteine ligase / carboxylate-amine ligase
VDLAFGREADFALGIEEELLLVHAHTLELANVATRIIGRVDPAAGEIKHELYGSLIECSTPVVRNVPEGMETLAGLREALREVGASLIGAGLHPTAAFGDVRHAPTPRTEAIRDSMRGLVERTPTAALHVHVGMPDADTAIDVCNRLRAFLPLLQALSANSAYWHGVDSGFASARSVVFRGFPRSTIPPMFASWEHYEDIVSWCLRTGDLPDYTYLWWDVRLQPRLGTVEVRELDAQAPLADVEAVAGLVHAVAVRAAADPPPRPTPPEALAWSAFMATRDGLDATVLDARGERRRMREIATEVAAEHRLEEVERLAREGNGAERQRAVHARGGMKSLLGALVRATSDF